jgi:hypothetical protein
VANMGLTNYFQSDAESARSVRAFASFVAQYGRGGRTHPSDAYRGRIWHRHPGHIRAQGVSVIPRR